MAAGAIGVLIVGLLIGRYIMPATSIIKKSSPTLGTTNGQRELLFPTFWEAWDDLHAKYTGQLDEQSLLYGAVAGMVQAAGDPYTAFSTPSETKEFEQSLEGSFSGIGIEVGTRNGIVTVIAPLADSPADRAGIREGDSIVAIDKEQLTQDMALDEVVGKIRGERGTTVTLTVLHRDSRETVDIPIVRDTIEIESVKVEWKGSIAHITITSFNGDTATRFTTIAREVVARKPTGIILDVRNNPGGYLQASVDIASRFLEPGSLVVTEKGKTSTEYKARGNNLLADVPLVVLVNEGSASASEIVAGALHDQRNVPLVGTKTFGKGSVQELVKLQDGSSLRVTIAKWFTPDGRNINEEGIAPTIEVAQNFDTEEDEPLLRAQEELATTSE